MKRTLRIVLYIVLGIVALLLAVRSFFNQPLPQGVANQHVETMTQAIYSALNKPAWDSTRWIQWTFRDGRRYQWDKAEGRVHIRWKAYEVWLFLPQQKEVVLENGQTLVGEAAAKVAQAARSRFFNDSFWLIAPFKISDPGTTRTEISLPDGRKGLKVTYGTGGVTPGDTYVWEMDAQGIPTRFRMWVSILPIGGLPATWDNWITLPTGAKIATLHRVANVKDIPITEVSAGADQPTW